MNIVEGMLWPPMDPLAWKMAEHSAWYTGDAEVLANFYAGYLSNNVLGLPYNMKEQGEQFWGRQIKNQGDVFIHVPVAGDISEASANLLFAESPIVRVAKAHLEKASDSHKKTQAELDDMLVKTGFFSKIIEAAETSSAIGGVYIKVAWDRELSDFPLPVVMQADRAIPEFRFGILTAVTFWKTIEADTSGNKVFRLLERYERGKILYTLYLGSSDRLGKKVDLGAHPSTEDLLDVITFNSNELLAVYIPNMLPNRLDRTSYSGRSDYSGIEGLMDGLDEVYSCWMKDVSLAQAKLLLPESFLRDSTFNRDKSLYVALDIDPVSEGSLITPQQFNIRAAEFEKTSINFLERIITAAGYSPQTFGLSIQGRAESGTALNIRERKSFATKGKKENYWQAGLQRIIYLLQLVYNSELSGTMDLDSDINISFSDSITSDMTELSQSVQMLTNAMAASTDTKVRLLHPDWDEEQIKIEVEKITEEYSIGVKERLSNPDLFQMAGNDED